MSRSDDPKWTAFALGELEANETKSVREELERDPGALESVERLRQISALIQESLEDFSPIGLTASQRESILAISEERRRTRWLLVTVAAAVVLLAVGLTAQWMRSVRTQPRQVGNAAAKPAPPSAAALSQNAEVNSQASGRAHPIIMVDRTGKFIREVAPPEKYFGFRLSPDERQLAIDCCADSNSREIWLRDLVLGSLTRLTFGGASAPVWSPDGRVIVFSDPGTDRLYRQSSDGTGRRLALADGAEAALDFSPDGGLILFQKRGEGLWVEPANGGVSSALVQSPFKEKDARFSPDGRWLAYTSNESGRFEIYIRSVPDAGGKYLVSTVGSSSPRWSRDGRQIFYLATGGQLMSVDFQVAPNSVAVGRPRVLFQVPADVTQFEVTADGNRLILFGGVR
jgi:dipeptidyl aminopeptidase/acylaminoacyl peptidase